MQQGHAKLLLVEDNNNDAMLTRLAIEDSGIMADITHLQDGAEAVKYLSGNVPDIILLDLNMPKMDGRQVLAEIKKNPSLDSVSVFVLTTSDSMKDINAAYLSRANCYIVKPMNVDEFFEAIRKMYSFWCKVARKTAC